MATADYWSGTDLAAVEFQGLINEEVMQEIWDISSIPLPLTDMIGSGSIGNAYYSWTQDRLKDPDITNAAVDGQDAVGNDAAGGARVGNQAQISTKELQVTQRARNSDSIGRADELSYQVDMRQKELRRDLEAIMLTDQGSQVDDGDTVPGLIGALGAWLTTNTFRGVGGLDGGFTAGAVLAPTPGTARALTETLVRDMAQSVYEQGGTLSQLMSTPAVIRAFSEYLFTSSARVATQVTNNPENKTGAATALGSVDVFVSDFGVVLEMVSNRIMVPGDATHANLYGIDASLIRQPFLQGYRTEQLGKPGLSDWREISVDWGFQVLNEEGLGVIADIDPALPVTQS